MPTAYRGAMQAYIDDCRAANAYSPGAYPKQYTSSRNMSRRSSVYPYPVDDHKRGDDRYYRRPRGDSYRRAPPDVPRVRIAEQPPPPPTSHRRRRASINTTSTATNPSSGAAPPPRKSVRFTDCERPSSRRHSGGSSSMPQPLRPKTFARDAPPAAISESARDTARRLFHRQPSDGGRPSARPAMSRADSSRTLNTTRAEVGTYISRSGGSRRDRERDYRERDRDYGRSGGGRSRRR